MAGIIRRRQVFIGKRHINLVEVAREAAGPPDSVEFRIGISIPIPAEAEIKKRLIIGLTMILGLSASCQSTSKIRA